jgi:tetratricopeptide (TPR) repeat protein
MLGNLYLQRGRFKEALNEYRKALKLAPNNPTLLTNIGNALQIQGENEKALSWLDKAISQDPGNAVAHNNFGNALWSLGKDREAVAAYKRALELNSNLADTHRNLGGIFIELEELDDAIDSFNQALRINPKDIKSYQGLGRARNAQGNLDQAVSAYQKAIAIDPANAEYYRELGRAFGDHGEIEKAISAHRKAVEINPKYAKAYQALSKNKKFTEYDDDMKAMESLFSTKRISDKDSIHLAFGLGKAYEDLGNFDKSMEFVIKATRLKRNLYDYSISESRQQFDRIKEVFSPDFFSSHLDIGDPDGTPIFILGMPRSGTSLVEQILASHPDVFGAGELNDLQRVFESIRRPVGRLRSDTFPEGLIELDAGTFADLGKQYIARIRRYSSNANFITDKMPHNFLRIGFIRAILPNARIIHCVRDPMDNCFSLFKTDLLKGHKYSYDMSELGQYYKMYLELMDYWKDSMPGFIYDQSYEELVSCQKEQVSQLLQHCGLPWDDSCLDFHKTRRKVNTASNAQVSRPIYQDSVKLWTRYEKYLEPLRAAIYG